MIDKEKAVLSAIQAYNPQRIPSVDRKLSDILWTIFSSDEIPEGSLELYAAYEWLWVTNKRLLCIELDQSLLSGKWKTAGVKEYPYSKIISVGFTLRSGTWPLNSGENSITINFAGHDVRFRVQERGPVRVREFAELINSKMSSSKLPDTPNAPAQNITDPLADLERLIQFRTQGLLSEAEFKAAKAKLLGL